MVGGALAAGALVSGKDVAIFLEAVPCVMYNKMVITSVEKKCTKWY